MVIKCSIFNPTKLSEFELCIEEYFLDSIKNILNLFVELNSMLLIENILDVFGQTVATGLEQG